MMLRFSVAGTSAFGAKMASLGESLHLRIRKALMIGILIVKRQIQQNLSGPAHLRYSYYDRGSGRGRLSAIMGGEEDFGRLIQSTRRKSGSRYELTSNANPYPGIRTGAYRSSWRTALDPSGFAARASTSLAYPTYLERGTSKMKPYPVVGPSLEQVESEVMGMMNNTIWGAMRA